MRQRDNLPIEMTADSAAVILAKIYERLYIVYATAEPVNGSALASEVRGTRYASGGQWGSPMATA